MTAMKTTARTGDRTMNGTTTKKKTCPARSADSTIAARSLRPMSDFTLAACRLSASRNSSGTNKKAWALAYSRPKLPRAATWSRVYARAPGAMSGSWSGRFGWA